MLEYIIKAVDPPEPEMPDELWAGIDDSVCKWSLVRTGFSNLKTKYTRTDLFNERVETETAKINKDMDDGK